VLSGAGQHTAADTGRGDGVIWSGTASHPQARSRQERRGGEEEPTYGVQVGISRAVPYLND